MKDTNLKEAYMAILLLGTAPFGLKKRDEIRFAIRTLIDSDKHNRITDATSRKVLYKSVYEFLWTLSKCTDGNVLNDNHLNELIDLTYLNPDLKEPHTIDINDIAEFNINIKLNDIRIVFGIDQVNSVEEMLYNIMFAMYDNGSEYIMEVLMRADTMLQDEDQLVVEEILMDLCPYTDIRKESNVSICFSA